MGLRRVKRHPEVKGKVHAWVAVILGSLHPVGIVVLILLGVFAG